MVFSLQLPSLEWLLLDAASCSGATRTPETFQSTDPSAAEGAPAAEPHSAAAEPQDDISAAEAADAESEPWSETPAAGFDEQQTATAAAAAAAAAAAKAEHDDITSGSSAPPVQDAPGQSADSDTVSVLLNS